MDMTGMAMGDLGWWHWITFALLVGIVLYPVGRILGRIGFSPFWSIVALIPLANLAGLWIVALSPWPTDDAQSP
jgi:hypothetical protein